VGVLKAPPVSASDGSSNDHNTTSTTTTNNNSALNHYLLQTHASKLTFKISPVASLEVKWETTLVKKVLYVDLPSGILPEGSKESLITLLEYAEEELRCSHVVLTIGKNRSDRGSLLRVFNFFGFQILPPGHPLILYDSSSTLHMAYTIEEGEEEEDDGSGRCTSSEDDDSTSTDEDATTDEEDEEDGGDSRGAGNGKEAPRGVHTWVEFNED